MKWMRVSLCIEMIITLFPSGQFCRGEAVGRNPIAVMDEVRRLADQPLWPGFNAPKYPVALYTGEETFLFGHPQPPEGFARYDGRPDVWVFAGRHPAMRSNSKARIGGLSTATLLLTIKPDRPISEEASIVIHEAFHIFQETHLFRWRPNEVFRFTYPVSNPENYVLSVLEDHAWARALGAVEVDLSKGWAKAALSFRSRRVASLKEEHRSFEQGLENMEGPAFYVAHLALGEANSTETLLNILPPERFRWRFYATGGAIAALLDRFEPGWKQGLTVSSDTTLESLLRESLSGREVSLVGFSREEEQALREGAERSVELLLQEWNGYRMAFSGTDGDPGSEGWHEGVLTPGVGAASGWRVRIIAAASEPLKMSKFDAVSIMGMEPGELLHGRLLSLATPTGEVNMNNPGYVRHEFAGLNALTRANSGDPILGQCWEVFFAGFDEEPSIQVDGGQVIVSASGFEASFSGTEVEREGAVWTIRLAK